jgi:hypothetical protein
MKPPYCPINDLTYEQAHYLFEYRDGQLYWKIRVGNRIAGRLAGGNDVNGYRIVSFRRVNYKAHRVIWVLHGNDPVPVIDHIDGNPGNNRIENLRDSGYAGNSTNSKIQKRNKYGIKGLCWWAHRNSWIGTVRHKGKTYYTKSFKDMDKDKCIESLAALRESLHGDFARHF